MRRASMSTSIEHLSDRTRQILDNLPKGAWRVERDDAGEPILHEAHHYNSTDEWYDVDGSNGGWIARCQDLEVAEFIAAAHALVPKLAAENDELRFRNSELAGRNVELMGKLILAGHGVGTERQRADRWQKLAGRYDDIRDALRNCDDTPEGHAEFYRECAGLILNQEDR